MRTRGWWTVEPADVAEAVKEHGRIVVGEKGELRVELSFQKTARALSLTLSERFLRFI